MSPDDYAEVSQNPNAIGNHFRFQLASGSVAESPMGDNIVVFDFIREDLGRTIMDKMLGNIVERVDDEHDVTLVIGEQLAGLLGRALPERSDPRRPRNRDRLESVPM